jgi:curved DNA-binding protein CbpA
MNLEKMKSYYEVLEIPFDATFEMIHEGYVRAKNSYSGDSAAMYSILTKDELNEILEMIEQAYSVLSIPSKRREYDRVKGFSADGGSQTGPLSHNDFELKNNININSNSNSNSMNSGIENFQIHSISQPLSVPSISTSVFFTGQQVKENHKENPKDNYRIQESRKYQDMNHENDFRINRNEVEVSRLAATKRFRLEFQHNQQFDQEIENTTMFTGEFLKKVRDYKNVSLDRMCDLTKISKTYIQNIEKDEVDKLPALAYIRGFVFQMAKVLKLNPDLVANSYINNLKELKRLQK